MRKIMTVPIKIKIKIKIILILIAIVIFCVIIGNSVGDFTRSQYPITHEYTEENITERQLINQGHGFIISDTGNRYDVCSELFWTATPNHKYRIEHSYNVSIQESGDSNGHTKPTITNITRIT
jgi:hypothetical protein